MDRRLLLTALLPLVLCVLRVCGQHHAPSPCNPRSCTLPDCYCAGTTGPPDIPRSRLPQMVMLTFDDSVQDELNDVYESIFTPRRLNPNGCPIVGTFYVSHNWTNYDLVRRLHAHGHEIASHSVSHRLPQTYWTHLTYDLWKQEMSGQRDNIASEAGIPPGQIRGVRAPFLETGGDNQLRMMRKEGFLYDATFMSGPHADGGAWPFTLDYPPTVDFCSNNNCPKSRWAGVWELPLNRWIDQAEGRACAMVDACETQPADKGDALSYFWHNYNRFYRGNRAPFGIHVHANWLQGNEGEFLEALGGFIDSLLDTNDVYFVTAYQVIEWMRDPQPLPQVAQFKPWRTACGSATKTAGDVSGSKTVKSSLDVFKSEGTSEGKSKTATKNEKSFKHLTENHQTESDDYAVDVDNVRKTQVKGKTRADDVIDDALFTERAKKTSSKDAKAPSVVDFLAHTYDSVDDDVREGGSRRRANQRRASGPERGHVGRAMNPHSDHTDTLSDSFAAPRPNNQRGFDPHRGSFTEDGDLQMDHMGPDGSRRPGPEHSMRGLNEAMSVTTQGPGRNPSMSDGRRLAIEAIPYKLNLATEPLSPRDSIPKGSPPGGGVRGGDGPDQARGQLGQQGGNGTTRQEENSMNGGGGALTGGGQVGWGVASVSVATLLVVRLFE